MKNYENFEELIKSEKPLLMEYAHIVLGELTDASEYKDVFYIRKPNVFVCVLNTRTQDNINQILGEPKDDE